MKSRLRFSALALGALVFVASAQQPSAQQPDNLSMPWLQAMEQELIHHDLQVLLDPANRRLSVQDTITFPESMAGGSLDFALNSALSMNSQSALLRTLRGGGDDSHEVSVTRYNLNLSRSRLDNQNQVVLSYAGVIDEPQTGGSEEAEDEAGVISADGVFLPGSSVWIPDFGTDYVSFELQVEFTSSAESWSALSQGEMLSDNHWRETRPMAEVYLVAGDYHVYSRQIAFDDAGSAGSSANDRSEVTAMVYLQKTGSLTPSRILGNRYLDATEQNLSFYHDLLGAYPYRKFAVVEHFRDDDYNMPSFVLLGSQTLRLQPLRGPSYARAILHNWWGNSVYAKEADDWSVGLNAYLAEHLFQEAEGTGAAYRKEVLSTYLNTAHNATYSSPYKQARALMLWHALRLQVGDEAFLQGLRRLYAEYRFQPVSWENIMQVFDGVAEENLAWFYEQWLQRDGAPKLTLRVDPEEDGGARILLAQVQPGEPYRLSVPVALFYEGEPPLIYPIEVNQKLQGVVAEDYSRLQAVVADPYFDLFRLLDRQETPPTVADMLSAPQLTVVLPPATGMDYVQPGDGRRADGRRESRRERRQRERLEVAAQEMRQAAFQQGWQQLAQALADSAAEAGAQVIIASTEPAAEDGDDEDASDSSETDLLESLPSDRSVWVLGRGNPLLAEISPALSVYGVVLGDNGLSIDNIPYYYNDRSALWAADAPSQEQADSAADTAAAANPDDSTDDPLAWPVKNSDQALLLVGRHPANPELTAGFIHLDHPAAIAGLTQLLPHYARNSYLGFAGPAPSNNLVGLWRDSVSPLRWLNPQADPSTPIPWHTLPPHPPLAQPR